MVAHFWIVLSIPGSHVGRVTLEKVIRSLKDGLRQYSRSEMEETATFDGYVLHLPTVSASGE